MSDQWVRTSWDFPARMAYMTLPVRAAQAMGLRDAMRAAQDGGDVAALEAALCGVIASLRPDLAGGQVLAVEISLLTFQIRMLYAHPSLPPVTDGFRPDDVVLDATDSPLIVVTEEAGRG